MESHENRQADPDVLIPFQRTRELIHVEPISTLGTGSIGCEISRIVTS